MVHRDSARTSQRALFAAQTSKANCAFFFSEFLSTVYLQQYYKQLAQLEEEADAVVQVYQPNLITEAVIVVMR